jgi:hypothetical protein
MKAYRGMEVRLIITFSAECRLEAILLLQHPYRQEHRPKTHFMDGWVRLKSGLEDIAKRKHQPLTEIEHRSTNP